MAKTANAICKNCGKAFKYDPKTSKGKYCSIQCTKQSRSEIVKSGYTDELKAERSRKAKEQMQDPAQIKIRKEKCGYKRTPEQLEVMSRNAKKQMAQEGMRDKIGKAKTIYTDYRQIAIDAHGTKCQRCGEDLSQDLKRLAVHHINGEHYIDEITDNSPENLMVLCNKCHMKLHLEMKRQANKFVGQVHFEKAANEILEGLKRLGFEIDYDNFHNTPKRFARAYQEIFEGCVNTKDQVNEILATRFPSNGNDSMVIATDIVVFSMCPHHLLPVEYHVCVGYIPNKKGMVLGISKLSRLVEVLAKRPVLQERFTQDIVNELNAIKVQGAVAFVEGQHMCMRMRGTKAINTTITTTAVSGAFAKNHSTKEEFMLNIRNRMKFK